MPYVIAHPAPGQDGELPVRIYHDAQTEIRLVGGTSGAKVVIGPAAELPAPLVTAPGLTAVLAGFADPPPLPGLLPALSIWAAAVDAALGGTTGLVALQNAIGKAQDAISTGDNEHPAGYRTTKVESSLR